MAVFIFPDSLIPYDMYTLRIQVLLLGMFVNSVNLSLLQSFCDRSQHQFLCTFIRTYNQT